jgi:Bacterial Ig-like domain (group 3)
MKLSISKTAAVAVVAALAFGSLAVAGSASAAVITTGTIQLHGPATSATTLGPVITSGSTSDTPMFRGLTVSQGCPAGFQQRSDTTAYQNGVKISSIGKTRDQSVTLFGATGLDGNPISMSDLATYPNVNAYVDGISAADIGSTNPTPTALVAGAWEIRVYCSSSATNPNFTTDPYFVLPLTLSADLSTWSVAVAKTTPSVSLVAAKNADTTVTLTATVKKADGTTTATDAVGSVKFFSPAGTQIGTGTVANGVATFTTAANAVGSYQYTAQFVGNNDATYNDSAVSGSSSVTFSGPNSGQTTLTVTIPAGTGALTLSGVPTAVNLGTAALNGSLLTASAPLGTITVTDTRQSGSANWNLTGQDTDFTSGSKSFDGGYLGWAPALVGTANAGTAGAAVLPGPTGAGLKGTPQLLATGGVVVGTPATTVGAQLNLAVPAQTAAGVYTSTLTITLA